MKKIPFDVWLLLLGMFITSCAAFGSVPFLSLYLRENHFESLVKVGGIVAIPYITSSFLGFIGGKLADSIGAKLMPIGSFGIGLGFLLYGYCSTFTSFVLSSILIGVSRSLFEPAVKALLSKKAVGLMDQVFRLRYLAFCFGAIIGPVIGGLVYDISGRLIFVFTFFIFALYAFAIRWIVGSKKEQQDKSSNDIVVSGRRDLLSSFTDKNLLILIVTGTVSFFMVSSFESLLPLLLRGNFEKPAKLFSYLFSASAVISIAVQVPLTFLSKKLGQKILMVCGSVSFATAFLIFGFSGNSIWPFFVGTFFYAIAEAIVLPGNESLIGDIAPEGKKATYFGIAECRQLGFCFGPIIGTMMLEFFGSFVTFQMIGIAALTAAVLNGFIESKNRKDGVMA